jgi:hypothetical protein
MEGRALDRGTLPSCSFVGLLMMRKWYAGVGRAFRRSVLGGRYDGMKGRLLLCYKNKLRVELWRSRRVRRPVWYEARK